ncbi:MAG TPA: ATP synthase F1 subunit gamma [Thermotogota bacterium]|nr:ATP synthase F1 subunit gamma [Thermotogota bacterium]HPJ89124.1 ATP synthase F1 subunit gamma [Thermotogota bacterium]HPR96769.1 ATP synthase F1 subunit gamma [Thermotogota bacterium]
MGRGKLRAIKRRIESTRSTEHITHAMEMVATAKVNKAFRNWHAFSSYVQKVDEIVKDCMSGLNSEDHPLLFSPGKVYEKTVVFLISSDMGLAGAYNLDLIRAAEEEADKLKDKFAGYMVIGTKGLGNFRYRQKKILYGEDRFYDKPNFATAEMLVNQILTLLEEEKADSFKIVYSKFHSSLLQKPRTLDLLPILPTEGNSEKNYRIEYEFEPDASQVLDSAIPLYLSSHLMNLLLEAQVSELYSRQNAMRNATENAENLIEKFTLDYNKARQASITNEIIEIVNGAEALKG